MYCTVLCTIYIILKSSSEGGGKGFTVARMYSRRCSCMMTARDERARNRAHRRWERETPRDVQVHSPWFHWRHFLVTGLPADRLGEAAARRAFYRNSMRTALMRHDPVPDSDRRPGRPLVASTRPGAKLGPGPRCRFCLVLLSSVEWCLERCMAHWDADIADCPATEFTLRHFVSSHEPRESSSDDSTVTEGPDDDSDIY